MKSERPQTIDQRLVRALAHPLRVQILEILTDRVASPNSISIELDARLTDVAYHTRILDQLGYLELVDTARRRGATEHFYTAKPRGFIGDRDWRSVPRSVRTDVSGASLQTFIDKAIDAVESGTIDDREDTTFCWMPLRIDPIAWREITAILDETIDRILAAHTRSRRRLDRAGGEEALSTVMGLCNFETRGSRV